MTRRIVRVAALTLVLGFLATAVWWVSGGGRWYVVRSPSMGTAAPVGTLLWVHPVEFRDVHRGDVITFRPPGEDTNYSHRVLSVNADGTLSTKGDITAPDPWRLHAADVLGRVEARWYGVGWLVRAAPIGFIGLVVIWLLTRLLPPERRTPAAVLGASVTLCVVLVVLRPLTGVERLGPAETGSSSGVTSYVATGALPVRVDPPGAPAVLLHAGEVATVRSGAGGAVGLQPEVAWWWWLLWIAACVTPASVSTVRAATRPRADGRHRVMMGR